MMRINAVEQILSDLRLTEREKQQLAQWLQQEQMKRWGNRLEALWKRVDERRKGLPRLSMAEIVQEVKAYRRSRASRRRT